MKKKSRVLGKILGTCVMAFGAGAMLSGCSSDGKEHLEMFSTKMENHDTLQKFADGYMKEHPEVVIEFQSPPEGSTVLRTKLTKNRVPDIIFMGGDATYKDVAGSGMLMDLGDMDEADEIKDAYKQQLFDRNKDQEKKMYGLPYATNAEGIIYNEDIFKANGIKVPTTYEELIQVCETLEAKGVQPFYYTFKDAWTVGPFFMPLAANLTPDNFLTDRAENKTTFAKTHTEVAEKMLELTQYGQKDYMGKSYDDGNIAFANGQAAMYCQGTWAITNIRKSNPDIRLNMFTFPAGSVAEENKVVSGVDMMATISNTTKHEETAKDFIKYIFREENMKTYMTEQFAFSGAKGYEQEDPSVEGLKEVFAEDRIVGFPDHFYPTGFDFAVDAQAFIGSDKDIESFLDAMDTHYDKYNVN